MNELLLEFLDGILQERNKHKMRTKRLNTNSAAEKAKSMGLERKPGFGNYGPRNSKEITHRSIGGELVAVDNKNNKPSDTSDTSPSQSTGNIAQDTQDTLQAQPQQPTADEKTPPIPLPKGSATKEQRKLDVIKDAITTGKITFDTDMHKIRVAALIKLWEAFVYAPTEQQQVKAVRALVDLGFIESSDYGKKIYLSDLCVAEGLGYKALTGTGSEATAVTKLMNEIAKKHEIEIPPRDGSRDSVRASALGPASEAAIAAAIFSSEENGSKAEATKSTFEAAGGNPKEIDAIAQEVSQSIQGTMPSGSTVTGAVQIGGLSANQLNTQYNINKREDPTDVIVEYTDEGGNTGQRKLSIKVTSNPKSFTLKNAGTEDAGEFYLGDANIDAKVKKLRKLPECDWTEPGITDTEVSARKRRFKEEYTELFAQSMKTLADQGEEGQAKLEEMWRTVHGCGNDVYTVIVDRKTRKAEIKDPNHYCNPRKPFTVKRNGTSVTIEMAAPPERQGNVVTQSALLIRVKTEQNGTSKLLFEHATRRVK